MFHWSNPRWTRLLLVLGVVTGTLTASAAFAGNTHSEGGAVSEAPGVPETDGTATVQIYWTGDSAARTSVVSGTTLPGYWLHDVGFALARPWQVGDEHAALLEFQTGAGTAAHAGYYGMSTKLLTSLDPDAYPSMTVRAIPAPIATAGGGFVDVAWNSATTAGSPSGIAGYNLYRSTDGIGFAKLNGAALADTTYHDATTVFGTTYQYALGLVYRGTPALEGTAMSANSAPVTPLDATPPDVPEIAAEPGFTPGAANAIAWSSEAVSGATAYYAECALDAAFSSLVGNSGWIADTNFEFSGLADGRTYYYRVRARDAALNVSDNSAAGSSRQDASAPASHLLALGGYKATPTVNLEWAATDSLSGVAGAQLFFSKDGGDYTLYPGGPYTTSPIAFDASTTGGDGSYAFYTLASDAVANAESAPETPDATTMIDTQAPGTPTLAALPSFTPGATRDVAWDDMAPSGANAYRTQASLTADFATIAQESDWIDTTTHTFTGLEDAKTYYYRVQARDAAGNESAFGDLMSSTQDASAPATAATALPALSNVPTFDVAWTGADTGSGLSGIEMFWSKDGGAFTALAGGPYTTSPIAFDAAAHGGDGTYTFYTLGTDAVANAEAAPASADAQITIDTAAPAAPTIASMPAFSAGASRSLDWSAAEGAAFLAEASTTADFASIAATSDWMAGNSYNFTGLADGQIYHYRVRGRDAAGNESAFSAVLASTQDATPPATAAAALPAISSATMLQIAWSGSDATSGLTGVQLYFSKDGGAWDLYPGGPYATSPIAFDAMTTGGDGAYAFHTRGTDAVANLEDAPASADAQTTIDTAAPGAPSIAGLQTFAPGSSLMLAWSDESASGAAAYDIEMSADAGFSSIAATSGWIAALDYSFNSLTDGQRYYFRVKARDAANNETGWSGLQSSTMDATAPASNLDALPALSSDAHLAIAWHSTDATSGIQNLDLYYSKDGAAYQMAPGGPFDASPIAFDATASGDGAYAFYVRTRDRAGNLENAPASAEATTMLDTTAPGGPTIAALPAFTAGTSRAISWADLSGAGATAYRAQVSTTADFASIAFDSDWMAATSYEFTGLADGQIYYYRTQARDAANNAGAFAAALSSTQDASAPQSQIAALPATSASMNLSLAWSGADAASGLQNIDLYWSKDGGAFTALAGGPFTTSPIAFDASALGGDGNYAFYTLARDAVGNLEAAPASADAQTTIDTAAPNAPTIASLPNFRPGSAVTVEWSSLGAAADGYRIQMASSSNFAAIDQQSGWIDDTSFAFSSLQDAHTYWFRVQARDAAQNASGFSAATSTTMDATAPTSQLAALPALLNTATPQLDWSGSDMTSGVASVDLYYSRNGGAFSMASGGPFTSSPLTFDATQTGGDGQYAFYIRAHDAVGNIEAAPGAPDASARIDMTPPNVPSITALPEFAPGDAILLAWSNQSASGATEYQAEMSANAAFTSIMASSGWIGTTSFNFNGLDDGATYWFRVKSRDAAQNESAYAANQTTTLDDTAPSSAASALAPVTITLAFPVAWTGSDATSGIATIDLYYAKDGGAYTLYPGGPYAASPIAFDANTTGGQGNYAFYTRARDRVANREPAPGGPDAQTIVNTNAVGVPTLASLPNFTAGASRTLDWSAGPNNAAYFAQAAIDAGFSNIIGSSGWITTTSFTFNGLADTQTYWYRVKGRSNLAIEGSYSNPLSSTQDATAPASQADALANLMATQQFMVACSASDATSGIAGVRLYAARDGGAFAEVAGGPFTSSPIAFDASATGGDGTYAFYTRAVDNAGNLEGAPSSADATTIVDTTAPSSPAMIAEPAATQGTANNVAWSAMNGATEYFVQCATDAAFMNLVSASGWITATNYTFSDLLTGTTYWYHVRARDAAMNASVYSAAISSTQSAGYVLPAGWNLVSFNVNPTDTRIDRVLGSIAGSYSIVRTYDAAEFQTYLPSLPIGMNDLQNMDAKHGYWIYMSQPDTLVVGGTPANAGTPIDLGAGWNLAGYLPATPMPPSAALATIAGSYSLARSYEPGHGYRTYYPSLPSLSDLTDMKSGQGYWLYMTAPDQLVYGGLPKATGEAPAGAKQRMPVAAKSDAMSVPTVMDLYGDTFTMDGQPAPASTVVEAYDAQGKLVGSATVKEAGVMPILHIHGDISITEADEGATPGELLTLKVRGLDMTWVGGDQLAWSANEAKALKLEFVATESLLPKAFALAQNAPNPFNPSTTIAYAIPGRVDGQQLAMTRVDLRIFDIRGRVVRTLVSQSQVPGRYSVLWDGRDDRGASTGSGMYFYRLQTEQFTQSHKMMLIK